MINEPLMQELKAITDYLDLLDKDWRAKIRAGASGTMTPVEEPAIIGYITPNTDYGANVRRYPTTANSPAYKLAYNDSREVIGHETVGEFVWHRLADKHYVRADVVTFSVNKPQPITPINAAIWPAPTRYSSITTRHEGNHNGIDLATGDKRPLVYSGLSKGVVVQAFKCPKCDPNGTPGQRMISNAFGYGGHVIVRYKHADLSPAMQKQMTGWINGAGWQYEHLFVMFAHLSSVAVEVGQELSPEQAIGTVGSTGDSTGNHLHLETRRSTDPNAKWGSIEHTAFNPVLIYEVN